MKGFLVVSKRVFINDLDGFLIKKLTNFYIKLSVCKF